MARDADGLLAQRHLGGDPQAFGALVDRYQAPVLTFIHYTVRDRERAEELAQEVFVRAYRHLHRLDPTTKFSTWIYTIASNLVWKEHRRRRFAAVPLLLRRSAVSVRSRLSEALQSLTQLVRPASYSRGIERRTTLGRPTQ